MIVSNFLEKLQLILIKEFSRYYFSILRFQSNRLKFNILFLLFSQGKFVFIFIQYKEK